MLYKVAADIVVLVHLLWIIFLVTGAYWGRRKPAVRNIHIAGLGFAVVSQVFGWYCPLTHLEIWLREHQGEAAAYSGSFIVYYLEKLIYVSVPPALIFFLTIALVVMNVLVYIRTFRQAAEEH